MARGNRDSGWEDVPEPGGGSGVIRHAQGSQVIVYIRLPAELDWVIRQYQFASRMPSLGYTFQSLLETHPVIVAFAEKLYNETQASPGGTRESS